MDNIPHGLRAQVTIEFILIMVIMITILSTIAIPMINEVTDDIIDTSVAVSIASSVQRIVNTGEDVSMMGCGSYKNITIFVESDPLAQANIFWYDVAEPKIGGNYTNIDGTFVEVFPVTVPKGITLSSGCPVDGGNTYHVKVEKGCLGSPLVPDSIGDSKWFSCNP